MLSYCFAKSRDFVVVVCNSSFVGLKLKTPSLGKELK